MLSSSILLILLLETIANVDLHSGYRTTIFVIVAYITYYTLLEGLMHGRTIGKLVTRTRAVTDEGHPVSIKQAFYRSGCRVLAARSFRCVHDQWTNTRVVKIKQE